MTTPLPHNDQTTYATLRRRWLTKYVKIQEKYDAEIRTALTQAAEDAHRRLTLVTSKKTFSASVRTAQIRLAMKEMSEIHNELFGSLIPVIKAGHGEEAIAAVDGLGETDRRYLKLALSETPSVEYFLESQRQAAKNGVAHAIAQITESKQPLSSRVYRTRALANNWVQRIITSSILRGEGAKEIADAVRAHIKPNTPGGTSYAAMRLGRTELNNAFHATAITMASDRPWVNGMRWRTSGVHDPDPLEICTRLNGQIFPMDEVPKKPHPQCRCFVTPELESFEVFSRNLTAGVYRDWMGRNAAA